ncbi:FAD/NAD(P)-binding protein [Cyclobacterium amurskyense]|uniref:FAD/NAD(P)-binding protein n=1 Tax=Cyclobacterium amurskyense TaxID=320787 RepID=UPI0030DC15C5|tara:strand:- start:1484 stop:3304 length:1821 start_codon:yes stop_codon:yes gene_type:complete
MVKSEAEKMQDVPRFNIAIVGLGPKGFYAFERLLAQLKAREIQEPVAIHLFNQNQFFAAGNVYRSDQAPYLLMNYANKNINCWTDELPTAILADRSDFVSWLQNKTEEPNEALEEDFASRATVGSYLMEGFDRLCKNLPEYIKLVKHVATVNNIGKQGDKFKLFTQGKEADEFPAFDKILLTTGHFGCGAGFLEGNQTSRFIDFVYPTHLALGHIEAGAKVAVKGFGLTCIDAILALTEGRGGEFAANESGKMTYYASGKEPGKIYPYSRTGLPMMPRTGGAADKSPLYFLTEDRIASLKRSKPVSFEKTLLPLIIKECTFSYYRVLFREYRWRLLFLEKYDGIREQIEVFHKYHPEVERFNWETLLDPFANQSTLTHAEVSTYIEQLIFEAEKGPEESPLNAAFGTWRRISQGFNEIYSFGGLDAASHKLFDRNYFGLFNRIAYGPPVKNMKKMLALAQAGIVDFGFVRGATFEIDESSGDYGFLKGENQKEQAIDCLINARIPRNNESETPSPLYRSILEKGIGRKFLNASGGTYTPGCMDMDARGRMIAKDGKVQEGIALYGTPTEGLTLDNDTLSRKRNNLASQWAEEVAIAIELRETVNQQ